MLCMIMFLFAAILFISLTVWRQWVQMRKTLFRTTISTTKLRTELVIKCGNKHLVNFEKNSDETF